MKYAILFSAAVFALIYCAVFVDPFLIWLFMISDDLGKR
jgi:hypothetical protein